MRGIAACAALFTILASPAPAAAWGTQAHRRATEKAIEASPAGPWRDFLRAHASFLSANSVTADRRRSNDRADRRPEREGPRHYIDLEKFERAGIDAERLHPPRRGLPDGYGFVPWAIEESVDDAAREMRAGDWVSALRYLADLAHYAEDACVPLHTTENHDGQSTNQRGVHGRWESDLVRRLGRRIERRAPPALPADSGVSPWGLAWEEIRRAHAAIPGVLAADRAAAAEDPAYGEAYLDAFEARAADGLLERFDAAARLAARLWRLAHERAGRPAPPAGLRYVDRAVLGGALRVDETRGTLAWSFDVEDVGTESSRDAAYRVTVLAGRRKLLDEIRPAGEPARGVVPLGGASAARVEIRFAVPGDVVQENDRHRLTWTRTR